MLSRSQGLFVGNLLLTDREGSLVVTGQVQRLRREGKVDPFGFETLHDPGVDPAGVIQKCPVIGRVVPVDDQDVQRVDVEFIEGDPRRKVRMLYGFVGMDVLFGFVGGGVVRISAK